MLLRQLNKVLSGERGMSNKISRAEYLRSHPNASAWAELASATNEQMRITPGPVKLEEGSFAGKRALILGAGVGGLTTPMSCCFIAPAWR